MFEKIKFAGGKLFSRDHLVIKLVYLLAAIMLTFAVFSSVQEKLERGKHTKAPVINSGVYNVN